MGKYLVFASVVLFTLNSLAFSMFDGFNEELCNGYYTENNGSTLVCVDSDSADIVLMASPDFSIEAELGDIYLSDIVEMGLMPDDSTDHIYNYKHPLLNEFGKVVGFLQVVAARNSEWNGSGVKLTNRYDLNGQLVLSKAEGI